jgi:hypothetical protein
LTWPANEVSEAEHSDNSSDEVSVPRAHELRP